LPIEAFPSRDLGIDPSIGRISSRLQRIQLAIEDFPWCESRNSARTREIPSLACDFTFSAHDIQPRVHEISVMNGGFSAA
jgi:hypothetical protein